MQFQLIKLKFVWVMGHKTFKWPAGPYSILIEKKFFCKLHIKQVLTNFFYLIEVQISSSCNSDSHKGV